MDKSYLLNTSQFHSIKLHFKLFQKYILCLIKTVAVTLDCSQCYAEETLYFHISQENNIQYPSNKGVQFGTRHVCLFLIPITCLLNNIIKSSSDIHFFLEGFSQQLDVGSSSENFSVLQLTSPFHETEYQELSINTPTNFCFTDNPFKNITDNRIAACVNIHRIRCLSFRKLSPSKYMLN